MRVVYARSAQTELEAIADYIAQDAPAAARDLVGGIDRLFDTMAATGFVEAGRRGRMTGTREIAYPPYVVVYRHDAKRNAVVILSVVHGARRR